MCFTYLNTSDIVNIGTLSEIALKREIHKTLVRQ